VIIHPTTRLLNFSVTLHHNNNLQNESADTYKAPPQKKEVNSLMETLPDDELQDTVGRLNNQHNDKDRLRLLKMTARSFTVDCKQLIQLAKTCQAADVKIDCIVFFYPNLADKDNFSSENIDLPFAEDKVEVSSLCCKRGGERAMNSEAWRQDERPSKARESIACLVLESPPPLFLTLACRYS